MPRTWFEHLVVSSPARQERSGLGVALSIGTHAALAASLVVIPALGGAQLPEPSAGGGIVVAFAPPVTPPTPPPTVRPQPPERLTRTARVRDAGPVATVGATSPLPTGLDDFDPAIESPPVCLSGCGPGTDPLATGQATPGIGLPGGTGTSPEPIRVGGPDVREPRRLHYVEPEYPLLAQRAGVAGLVILECVLDEGGLVRDVTVLRGHDLLSPAAVSAVKQWRYTPTLLNGVPVRVVMTVTVRFHIERR